MSEASVHDRQPTLSDQTLQNVPRITDDREDRL